MSKFLRKLLKKDEEESEEETEVAPEGATTKPQEAATETEETVDEEPAATEVADAVPEGRGDTIPYHDSIQDRLVYMLNDPRMADGLEGTHEFTLEFMAMGERFWISKAPLGEIETKVGKAADEDAHIRISNDAVSELLTAATFAQFSELYLKYYKTSDAGKFIKIEARKPISDMNRRGYARVPVLKLLIGAAR
jgi:hypothetical protein